MINKRYYLWQGKPYKALDSLYKASQEYRILFPTLARFKGAVMRNDVQLQFGLKETEFKICMQHDSAALTARRYNRRFPEMKTGDSFLFSQEITLEQWRAAKRLCNRRSYWGDFAPYVCSDGIRIFKVKI